jgi:short-subunit dehydrogenase
MKNFKDRIAVVTGAGGGLGRALCIALAERGVHLAMVDISEAVLNESTNAVADHGIKVSLHSVDISDKAQMASLPDAVLAVHGKVNLLINNAGITYQKTFATHSMEDWETIFGINWWGPLYGCHYFLDTLRQADEAHIVNVSSMNAFIGFPSQSSYCATKAAVKLLSESMWAEFHKWNIGVTSVHPGAIKTDMMQATLKNADDEKTAQKTYELAQKIGVTPEYVAARILKAIEKNKMRIRVGKDAIIFDIIKRLIPVSLHRLLLKIA